ncbi:MAG: hypothetical protein PHS14_00840 [Elusimicrobia bacterium]|nr:hypothetical protein [Elusimicrobiota bacterium]
MNKIFYALLGAAGALLAKSYLDRRARARLEGALPRPVPLELDGEVRTVADEISGPLAEI